MTTSTFKSLKQNRSQDFDRIASQFKEKNNSQKDERIWKPTRDKAGNGLAVIRFLPAPEINGVLEPTPIVRLYHRSFQGPTGKWYIENDLTTIGGKDPVNEYNRSLVGSEKYENLPVKIKEQLSAQKRKTKFFSNIYVEKDANNPENEGKVFLYEYGKLIQGMIDEKMNPQFEGDERFMPFDLWEGANLRLKLSSVPKQPWPSYKKSEWDKVGPLFTGPDADEKMEAIWRQCYSLQDLISADKFKSAEYLNNKLTDVLGLNEPKKASKTLVEEDIPSVKGEAAPWESSDDDDASFFDNIDTIVED